MRSPSMSALLESGKEIAADAAAAPEAAAETSAASAGAPSVSTVDVS